VKNSRIIITLLQIILSGSALAGGMGVKQDSDSCWGVSGACWGTPPTGPYPWSKVISLSLGPAWSSHGSTQTIFLRPNVEKTYAASQIGSTLASGELFYGLQKQLNERFYSQIGAVLSASSNAKLDGDIWEDADPAFNNYTYKYSVNHAHVAIKGLLLADVNYIGRPYLSASAGIGFNNAHDFTITPKIYQEVAAPAFQSHVTTAFTYTLGAGVQRVLNKHWQIGAGYQFAAWGESQLDRAAGQTLNSGLHLNNIYTNSIQLNLSYIS
jgi:opacity protein-like surface antigen